MRGRASEATGFRSVAVVPSVYRFTRVQTTGMGKSALSAPAGS
ncbi:hypothetical protein RRSWK_04483 [Rhodopirellula sp. SWK7]|nr:hypothetical protein RRSWK_04483 [Rhodopirellula sp. SWK7]